MGISRWRARRKSIFSAVMVAALLTIGRVATTAEVAGATHYRANQLSWHKTGPTTAEFHYSGSWRCSAFFIPCSSASIGDTFVPDFTDFGDGGSASNTLEVTAIDTLNDVVSGEVEFDHDYGTAATAFTASVDTCCRLSAPLHRNNPDGNFRIETLVDLGKTTASPVSSISPIVDCAKNAVCQFFVPAFDPDGQDLRYRFSAPAEDGFMVQPGPPSATNAATIDATTGQYSWDTTGASENPSGDSFFSTQVTVENVVNNVVVSRIAVDFFIRLGTGSNNQAPVFVSPTPADGTTYNVNVGQTVTFDTKATDADSGDTVTMGMIGKPADATYTTSAGNPATGTFTWTPSATGTTLLILNAQDNHGLGALQRSITINVGNVGPETCNGLTPTITGTDSGEPLYGTAGPDVILAKGGDDTVYGRGGDDVICAGAGNDTVYGGGGNNTLFGDDDDDTLKSNGGNDTASGGAGNDFIHSTGGVDTLSGDAGNDTIVGGADDDVLNGGDGNDVLKGNAGNDTLRGDADDDHLYGGDDNDNLDGGAGVDRLFAGNGSDTCTVGGDPVKNSCEVKI
jgi:Ca2+-binding RTX toxin-like protein